MRVVVSDLVSDHEDWLLLNSGVIVQTLKDMFKHHPVRMVWADISSLQPFAVDAPKNQLQPRSGSNGRECVAVDADSGTNLSRHAAPVTFALHEIVAMQLCTSIDAPCLGSLSYHLVKASREAQDFC